MAVRPLVLLAVVSLVATLASPRAWSAGPDPAGGYEHPACWGGDHIGEEMPPYVAGEECLFCHRSDVGPTWQENAHQQSVRAVDPDSEPVRETVGRFLTVGRIADVTAVLGGDSVLRFLKPNGNYGQYSLLSAVWELSAEGSGSLARTEAAVWDDVKYAHRCAGCHSTAVDAKRSAFSAPSLDCFACHGDVDIGHTADSSLALLAEKRQDSPRVVTSICAQCHIRSGRSATTGRPYGNQFIAGDNLFRDLQVDFSDQALAALNPGDRHVLENVRQVAVYGDESTTCLTCHSVHEQSTRRHQNLKTADSCLICHHREGPRWLTTEYEVSSAVCEYGSEWEAAVELAHQVGFELME